MSTDRRGFLKATISAGAFALAYSSALLAGEREAGSFPTPAPSRRFVLLRSPGDETFALAAADVGRRCLGAPAAEIDLDRRLIGNTARLHATLESYRGLALIGLMDDFRHVLLEESVRDLRGAVLCRGRHRGLSDVCVDSFHAFTTTARSSGIGAELTDALAHKSAEVIVQEHCCDGSPGTGGGSWDGGRMAATGPADSWGEALGAGLARMALGLWVPKPVLAQTERSTSLPRPQSRAFVSLVAQL